MAVRWASINSKLVWNLTVDIRIRSIEMTTSSRKEAKHMRAPGKMLILGRPVKGVVL
jgi:hypothetical protein